MKKLYGVIGDPIAHSMSPAMHNDLFAHYGIDAAYLPLRVSPEDLGAAVKGLRAIGASGFNVTIPHKTEVIQHLDKIDALAKAIGAVNTVNNENGLLVGYNTDGPGFVSSLLKRDADLDSSRALIIGAGGAARAIYFSMAQAGFKEIDLANRSLDKAAELSGACPYNVRTEILDLAKAESDLGRYQLIVQTTSIGMLPETDRTPISLRNTDSDALASDIIYNPLETKFLKEAAARGAATQNGIGMFVHQGALAFEKWTGIYPDIKRMETNVLNHLGGYTC